MVSIKSSWIRVDSKSLYFYRILVTLINQLKNTIEEHIAKKQLQTNQILKCKLTDKLTIFTFEKSKRNWLTMWINCHMIDIIEIIVNFVILKHQHKT